MVPTNGPTVAAIRAHCMPSRKSVGSRALPPLLPLPLTKERRKKKSSSTAAAAAVEGRKDVNMR